MMGWYGAAAAVVTAGSVAAIAVTGTPLPGSGVRTHRVATSCSVPASLPGQRVGVMLADMRRPGSMMGGGYGPRYGSMMGGGYGPRYGAMMGGRTMMLRALPQTVGAGTVSFVAVNHGSRTHELVVMPLGPAAAAGTRTVGPDGTVAETGSLGEASSTCAGGAGDGIRPGGAGWVTLTLRPGRYELMCNLPGHYAAGMYAELDVR